MNWTGFAVAVASVAVLFNSGAAMAEIKTKVIEYRVGDQLMEGYLAWDDARGAEKRPGVLVVHEWWGLTDYPKKRAEQLARLGYVAFAGDLFGKGKTTDDPKQAGEWAMAVRGNPTLARQRLDAALDVLKRHDNVDAERLAAIGYCFGGTMALNLARGGAPVLGVVSFHGDLSTATPATSVKPKILVLTGAADAMVPQSQVEGFEQEMKQASADFQVISYPGAEHAFTNPGADKYGIPSVKYNADADKQSWDAMQRFLEELFTKKR